MKQNRLLLPVLISISLHIGLFTLFWYFNGWIDQDPMDKPGGGVVWFNIDPGGKGTGGRGGEGAPGDKNKTVTKSPPLPDPLPRGEREIKKAKKSKFITTKDKGAYPKDKKEIKISKPKIKTPKAKKEKQVSAGLKGPGEGDGSGRQTGIGGGGGQGLGTGQGSGVGKGKGPGGIGPIGTGGSGSGGRGSASLAKIRRKILRAKRYPKEARKNQIQGSTSLTFKISPSGALEFVRLSKSSGHSILDNEALATVRRAAPFPYYPKAIRMSLRFDLKR